MCSRPGGAVDLDLAIAARLAEVSHRGDRAHEEAAHKGLGAALIHEGPQHLVRVRVRVRLCRPCATSGKVVTS